MYRSHKIAILQVSLNAQGSSSGMLLTQVKVSKNAPKRFMNAAISVSLAKGSVLKEMLPK
jgi:hypothetical protein